MVFVSPIWLLGLLPWVATVFYLLPEKRRAQAVPFLGFWQGATISSRRTARRVPPISIWLILMALLLAVLAAAEPARVVKANGGGKKSTVQLTQAMPYLAMTAMGARSSPHPQVMLRLENHSDLRFAQLIVAGVGHSILLPARGQSTDEFVDVDKLGDVIAAEIDSGLSSDSRTKMSLVRENPGIKILVEGDLPDSVKRIAAIYSKDRPGSVDAKQIIVSTHRLDPEQAGVWVQPDANKSEAIHQPTLPPEMMQNVLSRLAADFVATQDKPARQVWVNVDLREWEKTNDFVIFFGNIFDWLASGSPQYITPSDLPSPVTGHEMLNAVPLSPSDRQRSFANWLIIASLACVAGAAITLTHF